jgi:RNA polymerase sigma-70 factor (ECF subfamily)
LPWIRSRLLHLDPDLGGDVDDVAQDVMVILVQELLKFRWRGQGTFRGWLHRVVYHQLLTHWKKKNRRPATADLLLRQLEDPGSALSRQWDTEHNLYVMRRLLEFVEAKFEPNTVEAFRRYGLEDEDPARVARDLGMTLEAVYLAKSRVLKRLRQEGQYLLD